MTRFQCPRCGASSASPNDAQEGYCGVCHDFTGGEVTRMAPLPRLTVLELRELHGATAGRLLQSTDRLEVEPALAERVATLRSLLTAVDEALLNARQSGADNEPAETLRLVSDLRRRLAAMRGRSGQREYTGVDLFGVSLDAMGSFVVHYTRARTDQLELGLDERRPVIRWGDIEQALVAQVGAVQAVQQTLGD